MVFSFALSWGILAIAYCFGLGTLRRERCSQPTPLSVLSTRNRRVSESRYSNVPVCARSTSMGPDDAARSAKPLKPSRGVQCAHRFGNGIRRQAKIIGHIQPLLGTE